MYDKIENWIKKELVLKIDFVKNEFAIGWVWVVLILIKLVFDI